MSALIFVMYLTSFGPLGVWLSLSLYVGVLGVILWIGDAWHRSRHGRRP